MQDAILQNEPKLVGGKAQPTVSWQMGKEATEVSEGEPAKPLNLPRGRAQRQLGSGPMALPDENKEEFEEIGV